jgi:hypothetical protein
MNDSSPAEIDLLVSDGHELPGGTHVAEGELGDGLALPLLRLNGRPPPVLSCLCTPTGAPPLVLYQWPPVLTMPSPHHRPCSSSAGCPRQLEEEGLSHSVLRSKPDAHCMYAQDQVLIHMARM